MDEGDSDGGTPGGVVVVSVSGGPNVVVVSVSGSGGGVVVVVSVSGGPNVVVVVVVEVSDQIKSMVSPVPVSLSGGGGGGVEKVSLSGGVRSNQIKSNRCCPWCVCVCVCVCLIFFGGGKMLSRISSPFLYLKKEAHPPTHAPTHAPGPWLGP